MRFLDLATLLDPGAPEPLALQLARLLAGEIKAGRVAHGEAVPGSRSLAQDLGLSRHVVMSALWELEMEGWVESRPGSGTYVVRTPPSVTPQAWGCSLERHVMPQEPAFEVPGNLRPLSCLASDVLDLSDGLPDARLAPKEALGRGYHRALQRHGDDLLGRGGSRGNLAFREHLARQLRDARGLSIGPENLLITRGMSMSLALVAEALALSGRAVAVEDPGNPRVWDVLGSAGARLHPVPVDGQGMDTGALGALAESRPLALIYLTPRRHFPTTVPLAPERRADLLALARRHGFAVVEEDPDAELTWEGPPRVSLAAEDAEGRVIHLGSLSQLLATGLGLAYVVAPAALLDRLARLGQRLDVEGDHVLEWAVADLIRDGDLERHLARSCKILRERRDSLLRGLAEELGEAFEVQPCQGGQAVWIRTPIGFDTVAWARNCLQEGIRVHPGSHYDFHGRRLAGLRLGFAQLEVCEARKVLRVLHRGLEASQVGRQG
jgi:GntR family transcriptional regulator/MocR family aminotransferase